MLATISFNFIHKKGYQILNACSMVSIAGTFTSIHPLSVQPSQNCQRRERRLNEHAVRVRAEGFNGTADHLIKRLACHRHEPAMGWRGSGRPAATPVGAPFSTATCPLTTTVRIPVASKNGLA